VAVSTSPTAHPSWRTEAADDERRDRGALGQAS
jgi:hypothetical protein